MKFSLPKITFFLIPAMLGLTSLAHADMYLWEGGPAGNFSEPSWYDAQTMMHHVGPPGPADSGAISGSSVTYNGSNLQIGAGGAGEIDLSNGSQFSFNAGSSCTIGVDAGSNGTLRLVDANTLAQMTGVSILVGSSAGSIGSIFVEAGARLAAGEADFYLGDAGTGALTVTSGQATVLGPDAAFTAGRQTNALGSIGVSGDNSSLTTDAVLVLGEQGTGNATISGNGVVQSKEVDLGVSSGGLGTVSMTGAGTAWNSSDSIGIGAASNGVGNWSIQAGSLLNITGVNSFLSVGEFDSSRGTLVVNSGGRISYAGRYFIIGADPAAIGELDVDGDGSLVDQTGSPTAPYSSEQPAFTIGAQGRGILKVTNGGVLRTGDAQIASEPGSLGNVLVADPGSIWMPGGLFVAGRPGDPNNPSQPYPTAGGTASLTVTNGGVVLVEHFVNLVGKMGLIVINGGGMGVGTNSPPEANTFRVTSDGVLSGNGTISGGTVVLEAGAILSVGNSPGFFTIDGDLEQRVGSNVKVEIGGATPETGYDRLQVNGTANLAGNLSIRLIDGYMPTPGQTFRIVNAGSLNGGFASVSQPPNASFSVTQDATGVNLSVSSVVTGAPVITSPTTVTIGQGTNASYQITATNNPTSYAAMNLPPGLTVSNTGLITGAPAPGAYLIEISASNSAGSGSADLILNVGNVTGSNPALANASLLNISTRLQVQTGDNVLIGGFIVTGSDPKKVIIRGLGPSLNLPGTLTDPTLELHQGDTTLAMNDNWRDTQESEIIATTIPPTNDREAAIVATLAPGAYTAVLSGKNLTNGIGLVEVYDLSQSATSQLANISTRGRVETGDSVMIGGFICGGTTRVLVRALGPSLAGSGVQETLSDPMLELHSADGTLVAANDNWKDLQRGEIQATTIPPTDDRESALVQTLAPGGYTAIVRGKDNSIGVGLVEIYNLP